MDSNRPKSSSSQKLLSFRLKQSKSSQTCILAQELFGRLRYSTQELSGHESSSDVTHSFNHSFASHAHEDEKSVLTNGSLPVN